VVLIGHCAGAMFALLVARDDPRVIGAALMNAEGGDAQWTEIDRLKKESRHKARSYSQGALLSRERWAKFLGGRADYRSIARVVFKDILWYRITELRFRLQQGLTSRSNEVRAQQAAQGQQYLTPLLERGVALLLLHSEGSTGLSHIRATFGETLERAIAAGAVQLVIIPQSDHLFTMVDRQRQVSTTLLGWLHERVKTPLTAVY
jgi:pimeloyl-ACP methyl ester carboxylesterase